MLACVRAYVLDRESVRARVCTCVRTCVVIIVRRIQGVECNLSLSTCQYGLLLLADFPTVDIPAAMRKLKNSKSSGECDTTTDILSHRNSR